MTKKKSILITGGSSGIGLALASLYANRGNDLVGTLQPDVVAKKIASGIDKRKAVIVPGARARLMVWIDRHFPRFFAWSSRRLLRWKFR